MFLLVVLFSILSTSSLVISAPVLVTPITLRLPYTMRESKVAQMTSTERLDFLERVYRKTVAKYPVLISNSSTQLQERDARLVQMGDMSGDNTYYASILVGSPPVTFELALDTGSADMVLVASPCVQGCDSDTPLYIAQNSATALTSSKPFNINYQIGSASGTVARDSISFAGYTNPRQYFGAVTSSSDTTNIGGVSGVFGLAFAPLSTIGALPFMQYLQASALLPAPTFTFSPARWGPSQSGVVPGGFMTVGYVDSSSYIGALNYVTVTSTFYWMIPLAGIMMNGVNLGVSYNQVNIDTGTTNIYVPYQVANLIYNKIPGSQALQNGIYIYPCSAATALSFNFGGIYYSISAADFNIGPADNIGRNCYGVIGAIGALANGNDQYILGDAFLKNVFTVFNFGQRPYIAFALPSNPSALKIGSVPISNALTSSGQKTSSPIYTVVDATSQSVPLNVVVTSSTPVVSVAGLAATLQAAVVNAIATIVRNTVVILSCPKTVNKSNPVWICPT